MTFGSFGDPKRRPYKLSSVKIPTTVSNHIEL